MTDKQYLTEQLEYAEEQLMLADSISDRSTWGLRCDVLEAALADLNTNLTVNTL